MTIEPVVYVDNESLNTQLDLFNEDNLVDKKQLAGLNILIAEDNVFNQHVILNFFKLSDVDITIANNGLEVLEALSNAEYDLVLMDINMPVMDGITACQVIKSQVRYKHLPIIALTSSVTEENRDRCFAAGMVDFLEKPINRTKLINSICRHLSFTKQLKASLENTETHLTSTTGLDISYLKMLVGEDQSIIKSHLDFFLETAAINLTETSAAIHSGLTLAASKSSHKMQPSALSIGATNFADLCAEIEDAGLLGDMNKLTQLVPALEKEWHVVTACIKAWPQNELLYATPDQ